MTADDDGRPEPHLSLRAWASEHGVVQQAGRDIIVVHAGGRLYREEHYHSGAEEDERSTGPSSVDSCPYPGLRPYEWSDAEWFFGRETLVSRLVRQVEASLADRRPVAVVAPSGAGKSSLLRAGLMPALVKGQLPGSRSWPQLLLTPTAHPVAALLAGLAAVTGAAETDLRAALPRGAEPRDPAVDGSDDAGANQRESDGARLNELVRAQLALPADGRLILVVDQLEELFHLCADDTARRLFLDAVAALTGGASPAAVAVYGLRADAYGACVVHPHLREALTGRQVIVAAMSEDEVRRAMTRPAERGRLKLAPGLIDVILRDLRGTAPRDGGAYETGRLPLLAHALRATWQQRRDDTLTVGSYRDTGGIDGAVQATAEQEFASLSPAVHHAARQFFLGLARIGANGEVTRRRRTRADLLLATSDPARVPDLVGRFTQARLLTQGVERGEATVELTHEALLWAWPRLRGWIAEAGSGALTRQELEEAAVAWERGGRRDTSALYRSARLETARSWAARAGPADSNPLISAFLAASQRQQRRTGLLKRGAIAAITALALLASGLAALAFDQGREAVQQRDDAIFNRVAAEADQQRDSDPALAAQLDLVAYDMRPTAELRTRLTASAGSVLPTEVPDQEGVVHSVSFGADGTLATAADTLRLWSTTPAGRVTEQSVVPSDGLDDGVRVSAAYHPDGELLAEGSGDGHLRMLDASDPERPVALSGWLPASEGPIPYLRFSPDGGYLALASTSFSDGHTTGVVRLWDVTDPNRPFQVSTVTSAPQQTIFSLAFNSTGTMLAVGGGTAPGSGRETLVQLWDISDPAEPAQFGDDLGWHTGIVNQVAFSPLSDVLASAGSDRRVVLWDLSDPEQPEVLQQLFLNSEASSVAFSADARLLATGENSGGIHLWNVGTPQYGRAAGPALRGHTTVVTSLAFDPESGRLASGSGDSRVLLWQFPPTWDLAELGNQVNALAVSPDGGSLAVAAGDRVSLWDISDPHQLTRTGELPRFRATVNALAFRPAARQPTDADGGALDGEDADDGAEPAGDADPVTGSGPPLPPWASADALGPERRAELPGLPDPEPPGERKPSPDAEPLLLATGDNAGDVQLWDVTTPARPRAAATVPQEPADPVGGLVFDADGHTLVAAALQLDGGYIGGLRAWNVADPAAPAALQGEALAEQYVPVKGIAAAPDGGHLYTADYFSGGTFGVWETGEGTVPHRVGQHHPDHITMSLAADPRGRTLATGGSESDVRLWDVSSPDSPEGLTEPLAAGGPVGSAGFSPDGELLAAGNGNGEVRFWDTTDPARATAHGRAVTGHSGSITALAFAGHHGVLVSGGADGTIRLWQTDPARARAQLCAATSSAMTPERWAEHVSPDLTYAPPCTG